jgi:hypothetical protein
VNGIKKKKSAINADSRKYFAPFIVVFGNFATIARTVWGGEVKHLPSLSKIGY